jgi:hypothetical protein
MVNRGTYLMYLVVFLFIALAIVSVFLIICESRKHLCLARDVKAEFIHDMKKTNIKADYLDGVYNENKENINIVYNSKKLKTSFKNIISDIKCLKNINSEVIPPDLTPCLKNLKSVTKLEGDILLNLLMGIAKSVYHYRYPNVPGFNPGFKPIVPTPGQSIREM